MATIIGLLLTAYVLEAIVEPLAIDLVTPYHYIDPTTLRTYPFTTTVIIARALALFMTPLFFMSFIKRRYTTKTILTLVIAALSQLYALQGLATGNQFIRLEWSLAISLAGLALLPMVIIYFLKSLVSRIHQKLTSNKED